MVEIVRAAPSPALEIKTLMRIGYNFNSALADIIDNSLAAKAKKISIEALPGRESPIVSITDNGVGMSPDELVKNMRLSCKDAEEVRLDGDLGRFGSGMKTASFSQARKLIVITKSELGERSGAIWDIDLIQKNDSWDLQILNDEEISSLIPTRLDSYVSGTSVIWGKLQNFEKSEHDGSVDQLIASALVEVKEYVSLYFHRFLSGSNKVVIEINGSQLVPTDPFLTRAQGYQEGPVASLRFKRGKISIKTHVLPPITNMKNEDLKKLGGSLSVVSKQGLYIYREKRLIIAGDWMGIQSVNNLGALARVQVDIPSALDEDWSTDVKKEKLQLPPKVKATLKKYISDPVKRSKRAYKYRGAKEKDGEFWDITTDERTGKIDYGISLSSLELRSLIAELDDSQKKLLYKYLVKLGPNLPINHIYKTMSEKPKEISTDSIDWEMLMKKHSDVLDSYKVEE